MSTSWYIEVNAGDIPSNPLGEDGMETVIKICGIGGFVGFFVIFFLAIHTIYFLISTKRSDRKVACRFLYFELVILALFMISCLGMGLGRCDAVISGDFNEIGCMFGYYLEVVPYTIGKLLCYLLFVYRVKFIFRGSPFEMGKKINYVLSVGIICYIWIIIAQIIQIPINVHFWVWVHAGNVKMCVIPQSDPSFLVYIFTAVPVVDFGFGGYLFIFFVQRLRRIRFKMIELNMLAVYVQDTSHDHTTKTAGTVEMSEISEIEKGKTGTNKVISINTLSESDKKLIKHIESIVKKQSILLGVALISTLCTVSWMWILPMISNLLVYDGVINSICIHLIFSFCNPFWDYLQKKCCHV